MDVRGACCASGIVDARGACCAVSLLWDSIHKCGGGWWGGKGPAQYGPVVLAFHLSVFPRVLACVGLVCVCVHAPACVHTQVCRVCICLRVSEWACVHARMGDPHKFVQVGLCFHPSP